MEGKPPRVEWKSSVVASGGKVFGKGSAVIFSNEASVLALFPFVGVVAGTLLSGNSAPL